MKDVLDLKVAWSFISGFMLAMLIFMLLGKI